MFSIKWVFQCEGKLDCYCLLRILEIRMNPKIGYVLRHFDSTVSTPNVVKTVEYIIYCITFVMTFSH